jgi:asparagine synthase (glutamine-hydrolysing)
MCGFVFAINHEQTVTEQKQARLSKILASRGPDEKIIQSGEHHFGISTRLAVTSPTDPLNQSLASADGRYQIYYNGEIYNHRELRELYQKKGYSFKTTTDTEVLLAALIHDGAYALTKIDGMFSFVFFDGKSGNVLFARDPLGIKPLYYNYNEHENSLIVSTNLLAIEELSEEPLKVNDHSLAHFFLYRHGRDDQTVNTHVLKAKTKHYYAFNSKNGLESFSYHVKLHEPEPQELAHIIESAVAKRIPTDVQGACLLSGGIDSNTIAALAKDKINHAFTLSFSKDDDELLSAKRLASSYGMKHTVVHMPDDYYRKLPKVIQSLEEPLADAIILPTYYLFEQVGAEYKVVLSGEGADEIFAGYAHLKTLLKHELLLTTPLKKLASLGIPLTPNFVLNALVPYPGKLGPSQLKQKLKQILKSKSYGGSYLNMTQLLNPMDSFWQKDYARHLADVHEAEVESLAKLTADSLLEHNLTSWCENYTLHRLDKLSMAHGVEARVPYQDLSLVQKALSVDPKSNLENGLTKANLRNAFANDSRISKEVLQAKKHPFHFNLASKGGTNYLAYCKEILLDDGIIDHERFDRSALETYLEDTPFTESLVEDKKLTSILIYHLWRELKAQATGI